MHLKRKTCEYYDPTRREFRNIDEASKGNANTGDLPGHPVAENPPCDAGTWVCLLIRELRPHGWQQLSPCAITRVCALQWRTQARKNCLWTHACLIISQQNLKIECESTSQNSLGWEVLSTCLLWNIPFIPPLHQFLWQSPLPPISVFHAPKPPRFHLLVGISYPWEDLHVVKSVLSF